MSSDPTPTTPTIGKVTSASTLAGASTSTVGQQQLPAGYNSKVSRSPFLHNIVSARLDGDKDAGPCTSSQATTRYPSPDTGNYRSSNESRSLLEQPRRLDKSPSSFHDRINIILHEEEYKQLVPTIEGDDLVGLVDYLDKVRCCPLLLPPAQAIVGSR